MNIFDQEITKSGAWIGDAGQEQFVVEVPAGCQYESHELTVTMGVAEVTVAPNPGDTGELVFWVEWSYPGWFGYGKATFRLTVEAAELPADIEPPSPIQNVASEVQCHAHTLFGASGTDKVTVQLPAGYGYAGAVVVRLTPPGSGAATIIEQPSNGSTGQLAFTVEWLSPWLNSFCYRLQITARQTSTPTLGVDRLEWNPNPAIAGQDLHISALMTNQGNEWSSKIGDIRFEISAHAQELPDFPCFAFLDDNQKTKHYPAKQIALDLEVGEQRKVELILPLDATFEVKADSDPTPPPPCQGEFSLAGTYDLDVEVVLEDGNISLFAEVINGFVVES